MTRNRKAENEMSAAHFGQQQVEPSTGFASAQDVASANEAASSPVAVVAQPSANDADAGSRSTMGAAVRHWGPVVLTAIVVPGGIVIALAMLARRWYRHREATSALRMSNGGAARA
jgi:hypothetical protein